MEEVKQVNNSRYSLHTREGVVAFLRQYNYLKIKAYQNSNYGILVDLIDFDIALENSQLSERELLAIHLVFIEDLKQTTVAGMFDVTKQTVQQWVRRATIKISEQYQVGALNG